MFRMFRNIRQRQAKPYSFQYEAGRYPGHIDRIQQKTGDEHGIIHGNVIKITFIICLWNVKDMNIQYYISL